MERTVSVCILVRGETAQLFPLLAMVKLFADEIIVVGTDLSEDLNEQIRSVTSAVFTFSWQNDFSAAWNFAIGKTTKQFVMWLYATDILEEEDAKKIKKIFSFPITWDVCFLPYYYGTAHAGSNTTIVPRARIFRKKEGIAFRYPVYENLIFPDTTATAYYVDVKIFHAIDKKAKETQTETIHILEEAITGRYKDDSNMHWALGREYAQAGEAEKASTTYKNLLRLVVGTDIPLQQQSQMRYELAVQLIVVKKYKDALTVLKIAQTEYPYWREPLFVTGQIYLHLKKYKDALRFFTLCQEIPLPADNNVLDTAVYDSSVISKWISLVYQGMSSFERVVVVGKSLSRNAKGLLEKK